MSLSISPDRAQALLASPELRWRCIGPPRGGRVVAVAGDPTDRMTFYFGACAGGIWKTTDGGVFWECVSDGFLGSSSVGALAVAPSDPNVIYAGMGETTIRIDVSYGDGVYRSTDAGRTWTHLGLAETRHIGEIRIHPNDPDTVYVAAFGHAFGPNPERGVYRSCDGGKSWELVLHESDGAGAIDIAMDPGNPRVLYAATWEAHRHTWTLSSGGPGSKLWRTMDAGDTWEEISTCPGFAPGLLGKIGVAAAPSPGRVWALVEAASPHAGLYRSEDYGDTWTQVSPNRDLIHRPWYYTHVFADPVDAETVYVTNYQMWKSTDGGVSFSEITTPHGDNHDLWIDPADNRRMVQGNDGGANVSFNGGASWSSIYNQLTAQFYRMDVDDQFPYRVYATQQDNTSISVPSATEWGVITLGDCTLPGTGESGFIAVHPEDPNIVYIGAVGSSPGGSGALQRYDHRTRQMQLVNVWPEESTGIAPKDLRYRFAWTFPIVFAPHDPGILYAGGNHLFRSRDEGRSWDEISPDLTLRDETKLDYSGGPLTGDSAGAETYATLSVVVPSPHRPGEIWAGTDDGLVHVTRDEGATWSNVTPGLPEWAYVGSIEISAHDPDVVYLSATCYKHDDYRPYLFVTRDAGGSWTPIVHDFPDGEITRVIRADPERPGLLFVGTETGVFASLDDGSHWTRIEGGLPNVPVYDLKIRHGDLIAATHGRSFWVMDDLSALRRMSDTTGLVAPRPAHRFTQTWGVGVFDGDGKSYSPAFGVHGGTYRTSDAGGRPRRVHLDVGENPPLGALITYWLEEAPAAPVELTICWPDGTPIRRFTSAAEAPAAERLTALPGLNRFVWNMRTDGAEPFDKALANAPYQPLAKEHPPSGPRVPPGDYRIALTIAGREETAPLTILKDPRLSTTAEDFEAQFRLGRRLNDARIALRRTVNGLRRLRRDLAALADRLPDGSDEIRSKAEAASAALRAVEEKLVDVRRETPRDVLRHPAGLDDTLADLAWNVAMSDHRPPVQTAAVSDEIIAKTGAEIAAYDRVRAEDIAEINALAAAAGVPAIAI